MNVVFMGKHKRSAVEALEHLVARGCDVRCVVAPPESGDAVAPQRLDLAAKRHGIPLTDDAALYRGIEAPDQAPVDLTGIDLVISFLFWKLIRGPLIELGRVGCLNFHPAPLPDLRGIGGYNVAILEGWTEWGVSGHFVDERFDTGDLVEVRRFPIDAESETALSLDIASQRVLVELFREAVDTVIDGGELAREPQGEGRYVTREQFEALRRIDPADAPELTERRIRAFWYPPYDGATLELGGRTVTVIDRGLLENAAAANRGAGVYP